MVVRDNYRTKTMGYHAVAKSIKLCHRWAVNLAKVGVEGSNPFARSSFLPKNKALGRAG